MMEVVEQAEAEIEAEAPISASAPIDPTDHLGLVCSIAATFRGRGLDMDDLIQEGCVGLLRAREKFNPTRNIKFGTFATYLIRGNIQNAIDKQAQLIRLQSLYFYNNSMASVPHRMLARDDVHAMQSGSAPGVPGPPGVGRPIGPDVLDQVIGREAREARGSVLAALRESIAGLDVRWADVLRRRYGLDGRTPEKAKDIAREYGVSKTRIGQIERRARRKLTAILSRDHGIDDVDINSWEQDDE